MGAGDKQKLLELVESDPAYKEMEEDAYEMALAYADAEELVGVQKYWGKDGKVNMCEGIRGLIEDGRAEGRAVGIEIGRREGNEEATRNIVKNMLRRGMSEEDIKALAECEQDMVEIAKKELEEELQRKHAKRKWFFRRRKVDRKD